MLPRIMTLLTLFCVMLTLGVVGGDKSVLYDSSLFRAVANPDIAAEHHNGNSHIQDHDSSSAVACSRLCNRAAECQAAVQRSGENKCSTYSSAIVDLTSSTTPNNLTYLESVCADLATDRPSFCARVPPKKYRDCQAYYEDNYRQSGVYTIDIEDSDLEPFEAWCDFFDGHGWTVIQRRQDGSVDFYIYWDNYKNGFGNIDGEYWLGNDRIHELTQTNQKLNIYLEAADGTYRNGYWTQFYIADESDYYRLTISSSGYTGDAEDSFAVSNHNGKQFTTRDSDHDSHSGNCAVLYTGAWWYNACHTVNINGIYTSNGVSHSGAAGVNWCCSWKGHSDSLLKTIMRITRD